MHCTVVVVIIVELVVMISVLAGTKKSYYEIKIITLSSFILMYRDIKAHRGKTLSYIYHKSLAPVSIAVTAGITKESSAYDTLV